MDKSSIEQIFMFFNCTMSRDIPQMGKILRLYILEILGHPSAYEALILISEVPVYLPTVELDCLELKYSV